MPKLVPFPYQAEDVLLLESEPRKLIMHEPGLGKTEISTLACEKHLPCLVLTKGHLIKQWAMHLQEEYPDARIVMIQGTPEEKQAALLSGADWIVANYEVLRKVPKSREAETRRMWNPSLEIKPRRRTYKELNEDDLTAAGVGKRKVIKNTYKAPKVKSLVIDESHNLRGRNSEANRGARQIAAGAEKVLLLSATPIWREPDDLFGQLRILFPDRFSSYWSFVSSYCNVKETPWGSVVTGAKEDRLKFLLKKYAIRRSYGDPDVNRVLPDVIPKFLRPELTPPSRRKYDRLIDGYRVARTAHRAHGFQETGAGAKIHELRAIVREDKQVLGSIKDLINTDFTPDQLKSGFVIFTWYRESARRLSEELGLTYLTGEHNVAQREAKMALSGGQFIANIACLTEGVDLSYMRTVIFYEQDYLPGRMDQALKRVQRWRKVPSDDPVLVYYVVPQDTVYEHIYDVCTRRGATSEELLDSLLS